MHFHLVDSYIDTGSPLHRMDPRVKVVLTLALILLIGLTPTGAFGVYVGFFAIMMAGAVIARVDPLVVLKRSLLALPFAAAAITLVFTVPGPSLGSIPLLGWAISETGLVRFISILLKSTISVQAAVLLMMSTHFTDALWALGALHVPKVLVAIISFMYRYLFVLAEEAVRLRRARDSRSAVLGGKAARGPSIRFRAKTAGRMIGNLFVRSLARSERVYQAMVARGYKGMLKQLAPPALTASDILAASAVIAGGIAMVAASILIP